MQVVKKILISLLVLILVGISGLAIFLFTQQKFIKRQSIEALNKQLTTEVAIHGAIDLRFLSTFPNVSLSFEEVHIADKMRQTDTLASLEHLRLELNIWALLKKDLSIDGIYARDGFLHLFTNHLGQSNYLILEANPEAKGSSLLQLEQIALYNIDIKYEDQKNELYAHILTEKSIIRGAFYQQDFELSVSTGFYNHDIIIDSTRLFTGKHIEGDLDLNYFGETSCIQFKQNSIQIEQTNFAIDGEVCAADQTIDLTAQAQGEDLQEALALIPSDWLDVVAYKGQGTFSIQALLRGKLNSPNIQMDFKIEEGEIAMTDGFYLENLSVDGQFNKVPGTAGNINITKFETTMGSSFIQGNLNIADIDQMELKTSITGNLRQEVLNTLLPDSVRLNDGEILIEELSLILHQNNKSKIWQALDVEGKIKLDSLQGDIAVLNLPFNLQGEFIGQENYLAANGVNIQLGENDLAFDGKLKNFLSFILKKEDDKLSELGLSGRLRSNHFNLNDFILDKTSKSKNQHPILLPAIFGQLDIAIDELQFKKLLIQDIIVDAQANGLAYTFDISQAKALEGSFEGFLLSNVNANDFEINLSGDLTGVQIDSLFSAFDNFNMDDMGSENIKGTLDCSLAFSAAWKNFSEFDRDKFIMQSNLRLSDGELISFAPLMSLSNKLEVEQLAHLYFTDLEADVTVKDGWINIPMTTIQSNLLSLEAGGRHSFQDEIDYQLILNLKNLLAAKFKKNKTTQEDYVNDAKGGINLYISMTGTSSNPVIKYDKQSVKEKIKQDFNDEKLEFKNLFKKGEKSEFEQNEIKFEELREEDKYIDWED